MVHAVLAKLGIPTSYGAHRSVVFPVLIGSGKRLFANGTIPSRLKLVDTATSSTGVLIGTYARDGKVEYGAMGPETGNW